MENKPVSLNEWRKEKKALRNINIEQRERLSNLERFAVWITAKVGTMQFFFLILAWSVIWFFWNIFAPIELRFDPFPAFVLWLFISNLIQLILLPLLLIGQNLQGRHSEARAEADFEVNKKSEEEIEIIISHLERQTEYLQEFLKNNKIKL